MSNVDAERDDPERRLRALSTLERLHRVTRFLMLEHPTKAEEYAVVVPELVTILRAGHGAVKLIDSQGHGEYVVVDRGRRQTLRTLPAGYTGTVPEVAVTVTDPQLRPHLTKLAEQLEQLDRNLYESAGVQALIDIVDAYSAGDSDVTDAVVLARALPSGSTMDRLGSADVVRSWAKEALMSVADAFVKMILPGDVAAWARATLWLLVQSPDPHVLLRAVVPSEVQAADLAASIGIPSPVPLLRPELVVEALDHAAGAGSDHASRVGRGLQKHTNAVLRGADQANDYLTFHRQLHIAFLMNRSAFILFEAALTFDGSRSAPYPIDRDDLRARRDACEERRVIIANALLTAAIDRPASPNLTEFSRWEQWLAALRFLPLSRAIDDVDDTHLRLLFPERLRRIAEACVRLDHAPGDERELTRALRAAQDVSVLPRKDDHRLLLMQSISLRVRIAREFRRSGQWQAFDRWWLPQVFEATELDKTLTALEAAVAED
jgi:hypothetical protein